MCAHNWKHAPAYRRARELIAQGSLGDLRYLSLARLRSGPAGAGGSNVGGERWRLSAAGGGILIDHGWHVFYLTQWLAEERRRLPFLLTSAFSRAQPWMILPTCSSNFPRAA